MADYLNHLLFGWYPYLCLTVFLLGSWLRFDREQYSWRTGSSQLLRRKQLIWGSNLFHVGVLIIFLGHCVGLLTPIAIFDALGIAHSFKQGMAIVIGGGAGLMCLVGIALLTHRRLTDPRVRATSSFSDTAILLILLAQLLLGLSTIFVSLGHLDGHEMVKFMNWAQGVLTLQTDAWMNVADVNPIFKLHLVLGMTIFLLFPFTRLVHVWSAPFWYFGRTGYQIVRSRKPLPQAETRGMSACAVHTPEIAPQRKKVCVNGVTIPHHAIAQEAQNHRAATPALAFAAAARALVVRELLLQEARRLALAPEPAADADGRRETEEEALIRALVESQIPDERPDDASCRRYYENNPRRFRSADLFEAAHILFAAAPENEAAVVAARKAATELIALLQRDPSGFAAAARVNSACSSRENGGALGQFSRGQCAPEFEEALDQLSPGEISSQPTQTIHGLHVLRLDRKIDGATLPFEIVKDRIARHLAETRRRHAIAGFIAELSKKARIEGIMFAPDEAAKGQGAA